MLYVAFFKIKPGLTAGSPEIVEKSSQMVGPGRKARGSQDRRCLRLPGHRHPRRADLRGPNHDDIREMVNFWRDTTDFEVHPAVDLAVTFKQQGMKVT